MVERTVTPHRPPLRVRSYTLGQELGHGSFGKVYEATKEGSEEKVAIKAINLRRMQLQETARRNKLLKTLSREISILRRLPRHENIVVMIESIEEEDPDWCFIVLELVAMGDLLNSLMGRNGGSFEELEAAFVFRQLVAGLSFLHEHDVIHRDLKLENVLVSGETKEDALTLLSIKITDFGLSKEVGDGLSVAKSAVGSPSYTAPEVWKKSPYTKEVDLWSLGALLYTLLAGRLLDRKQTSDREQADVTEIVAKLKAGREARTVVAGLLQVDPSKRSSLESLKCHSWLTRPQTEESSLQPCPSAKTPSHSPSESLLFGSQPSAAAKASPARRPVNAVDALPAVDAPLHPPPPPPPSRAPAAANGNCSRDPRTQPRPLRGKLTPKPRMRLRSHSGIGKADDHLQVIMVDNSRVVCMLCRESALFSNARNLLHDAFPDVHALVTKGGTVGAIGTEHFTHVWPDSMARTGYWIPGTGTARIGAAGFGPNKAQHLKGLALAATIAAAAAGLTPNSGELPDEVQQLVHQVKNFRAGARGSIGNLGLQAPRTSARGTSARASTLRSSAAPQARDGEQQISTEDIVSSATPTTAESADRSDISRLSRTHSRCAPRNQGVRNRNRTSAVRDRSGADHSRSSNRRVFRRSRSRSPRGKPGSPGGGQHRGAHENNGSDRSGRSGDRLRNRSSDHRRSHRSNPGTPTAGASSSSARDGRTTPRVTLIPRRNVSGNQESRVRLEPARRA